jgi:hypothetical protein
MIPRKSAIVGIAIVGFWLVTMALLVQREIVPGLMMKRALPGQLQPFDDWFGVYLGDDSYVGTLHMSAKSAERDGEAGLNYVAEGRIVLTLLDAPSEMVGRAVMWIPEGGGRMPLAASISTGGHGVTIDGAVQKGTLHATLTTGGQEFPIQWDVGNNFGIADMLAPSSAFADLKPGDSVLAPAFDPLRLSNGTARVACVREDELVVRGASVHALVYEVSLGGMTSTVWLDEAGEVVQLQTPYGFTLRRILPEEAVAPVAPGAGADLLRFAAVTPSGKQPFRGARRMVARLSDHDPFAVLPDGSHQHVEWNTLTIVMPATPTDRVGADGAFDYETGLGSDPFIPSDHPIIVRQAQTIIAGVDGGWPQALALYQWVYTNIAKVAVPSVPSALDVLETREGDCNEHTVLFTALARAVGIPTRVAVGLVWSDDLQAFYYHAWPEVLMDTWIPMDPTLGQPIADATHIKLIEGNIERWPRLIAYLGRLRIEILDVQ